MLSYFRVVSHVNQIVDFGAISNFGVLEAASINTGVSPNVNVISYDNSAVVWKLEELSFLIALVTKAVRSKHYSLIQGYGFPHRDMRTRRWKVCRRELDKTQSRICAAN